MKNKGIEKLKLISENFKKNKDVKELAEAIKTLPPEIIELYNTILEKSKNEKE
tara:strand:+ start:313 stop:471 length:159 start_codon:yes stop_codon:yes gene_type:complete